MTEHTPDSWVILKITENEETRYKVLCGWSVRPFVDNDSWRVDSRITGVEKHAYLYGFYGSPDSVYWCHKGSYGLTIRMAQIYSGMKQRFGSAIELMPEDTNWHEVKW